jgi:SAM-dependent methyltransferase
MLRSLARTVVPKAARDKLWTIRHQIQTKPVMSDLLKRYCAGTGAEIGAGKTPYCDPTRTTFVDKFENNKDATVGADIIADASSIPVGDAVFDYVFSAHVLEHMQNTIAVLNEWLRILKPGGIMFTMLPHAERTLDRFRPITPLEHHLDDLERLTDEPDRTHFEDMQRGWTADTLAHGVDLETAARGFRDEWGADMWDWEFRLANGILHHHVWTQNEIVRLYQHLGMKILYVNEQVPERDDSFIVIAKKAPLV